MACSTPYCLPLFPVEISRIMQNAQRGRATVIAVTELYSRAPKKPIDHKFSAMFANPRHSAKYSGFGDGRADRTTASIAVDNVAL